MRLERSEFIEKLYVRSDFWSDDDWISFKCQRDSSQLNTQKHIATVYSTDVILPVRR